MATGGNTCEAVDWYEGSQCVLDADHDDDHDDGFGFRFRVDMVASYRSAYRVHGPWWPEMGHVLSNYISDR